MSDVDELDINPFFLKLQTVYNQLYESAQEKCLVVCIPQSISLKDVKITQNFAEMHILRPSPYFKGQYLTFSHNSKTVHLDDGGKEIVTGEGFVSQDKIRILNEELGYNKDYKPYRILILERPLDSSKKAKSSVNTATEKDPSAALTFSECRNFLRSFTEYSKILQTLDESLKQFNTNYMVLKDYMDDARLKLQNTSLDVTENCYRCSKPIQRQDPKFKDTLSASIESYIMGTVHQKMFGVVCEKFSTEDKLLLKKCKSLQDIRAEQLGVSPEFSCPLPTSVVELANIDCLHTPLEKLHCLKATVDTATATISSYIDEKLNPQPGILYEDKPCLTSDELIPILVTVIAQAKCSHLPSNMYYIENFHWSRDTKDRDNLSYCLVTFRAAIEYMSNTDFDHLMNGKSKFTKEISIEELMRVTKDMSVDQSDSSPHDISLNQSESSIHAAASSIHEGAPSKLDRQLQKISKMIQETTEEKSQKKTSGKSESVSVFGEMYQYFQKNPEVPKTDSKKKKEELGSFLNSLEDDVFDQSFGKQS